MQNGGFLGELWNVVTIAVIAVVAVVAVIAVIAEWHWGRLTAAALFVAGALLSDWLGMLAGDNQGSTDPRNWVGSSGTTYFLGATLTGALLMRALSTRAPLTRAALNRADFKTGLLASSGPVLSLAAGSLRTTRTALSSWKAPPRAPWASNVDGTGPARVRPATSPKANPCARQRTASTTSNSGPATSLTEIRIASSSLGGRPPDSLGRRVAHPLGRSVARLSGRRCGSRSGDSTIAVRKHLPV